jgi:hypothetical protein
LACHQGRHLENKILETSTLTQSGEKQEEITHNLKDARWNLLQARYNNGAGSSRKVDN